jgi:asparagine synthase (glutamine-hydrolysing)
VSAIFGVFGGKPLDDADGQRIQEAMRARGLDSAAIWRGEDALIGVSRYTWEDSTHFSGGALVLEDDSVVAAADASIYYRDDLRAKLVAAGCTVPMRASATELILAAYRAWGERASEQLEGDWAYIIWDKRTRRVHGARDHGGKRPLYYALAGNTLVVASMLSGVIAHPAVKQEIDLRHLAATLAQFWDNGDETCWKGVRELLAGTRLGWSIASSERPKIVRHWEPPAMDSDSALPFDDAAEQLRALLERSVAERLVPGDVTAVWMSGGWDSPSVFAAGNALLQRRSDGASLKPVSISYPTGDPGREDELIQSIADRWQASIHWLDVEQIPLFDDPARRAAERDVPFAHTYEHWNRALARGSRTVGARVAFDGNGGDQLFQVSDIFLSDLFRAGRWTEVARQWRAKNGTGVGNFWGWIVKPALPAALTGLVDGLLGRPTSDYLERAIPPWVRPDFARRLELRDHERAGFPRRSGYRGWRREAHFYLAAHNLPRGFRCLAELSLAEGIELRSPLYDRRVIELACTRPRSERNDRQETKQLLRASMKGLLPDHVLAPRRHRTGITTAYSDRRLREAFPELMRTFMERPLLAELGIVEPSAIRANWERYLRTGDVTLKIPLFLTLQVELWLRSRLQPAATTQHQMHDGFTAVTRY